ncbi:fungal-specific transcription factor domain-containing protein [Ephemerocybe angulata]|uniref:Fungal-specific transcription factor domain-containing protein n=1 Tax=Ephemerocybe angulata TaxID=980116 RepID=A0A8H6LXC9_9AGAR|nr:fungal-specific transcription factor domain-containing protein [Tulosesus angulatus]
MSAQDEEEGSSLPKKSKHSRMRGACDACRQKKSDSAKMPKNRCSRCTASGLDCTHFYMMKVHFPILQKIPEVVGLGLEEAKARMGPLLDTILSPLYQLPADPIVLHETMTSLAQYARALEKFLAEKIPEQFSEESPSPNHSSSADAGEAVTSPGDDSKNEPENPLYDDISALSDTLRENLLLESFAPQRFYGASSTIMLVKAAIDLNVAGTEQTIACLAKNKRPEFWTVRPWEVIPDPEYPPYVFPEPDLLCHLVEEYFTKSNPMFPLLNRSIFENGVRAGLHLVDDEFGGIVLGVCAVAALYSRDPRILLDVPHAEQSAGFKYYRQLRLSRDSFLRAPTLQELQTHTATATFLRASSRLDKCWHLLGVTLRAVQEIGLNRKQKNDKRSVAQSELCKRVFFCLWSMEQFVGAALGRPSCMRRADYGIDRPIECDDEFWENENPELAFKQPPGRHSEVTFFNRLLDLLDIFDGVQAAIYSVQKPISPKGFSTEEWNERQLAEFDSELNNWYENLPEFLRWDPDAPNSAFFNQSAKLYISFYWVKILMHRPFIALKNKVTKTFSSMAICTNSARAIIRIMTIQNQKGVPLPLLGISLNLSATVLLVNMWKERKSGNPIDEEREIDYIIKCIKILRSYDRCWQFTGRCW